jgi:hemerythrin
MKTANIIRPKSNMFEVKPPENGWNESLALGIPALDVMHKILFTITYDLEMAYYKKKNRILMEDIFQRLIKSIFEYFNEEESLIRQWGVSDIRNHRNIHDDFAKTVLKYHEENENGECCVSMEIASYIKSWLKTHIDGVDRTFVPLAMKARGKTTVLVAV